MANQGKKKWFKAIYQTPQTKKGEGYHYNQKTSLQADLMGFLQTVLRTYCIIASPTEILNMVLS
jgi:hypothetical protein